MKLIGRKIYFTPETDRELEDYLKAHYPGRRARSQVVELATRVYVETQTKLRGGVKC